jgi:uncharacterized membrane protein (DUF106 family)
MHFVNAVLRPLFDLLVGLMASWPVWLALVVWSIPVSIFALWIFKIGSNQDAIAAVKDRIYASLFEIRLFNDDLRAILRAQWEILGHVLRYQFLALKPMVWILPPVVLIMVHLHGFYGFRPLETGEETVLTVQILDAESPRPPVELEMPEGLTPATPGVWAPDLGQMAWRLRAESEGTYQVAIRRGDAEIRKAVVVGGGIARLSPERPGPGFLGQLEWPSEPPVRPETGFGAITLTYPEASLSFLGLTMDSQWAWMILFFVLTMVVALALKRPLGVEL